MNLMKYKKLFLFIALGAIVFSIGIWAVKGLNFGIEFTGGTNIRFPLQEKVTSTEVLAALDTEELRAFDLEISPPQPYNYLDPETGTQKYGVLVQTRFISQVEEDLVLEALDAAFGPLDEDAAVQINQVEPIIGKEMLLNAIYAVVIAWALMLIYIAIRFEFKSGVVGLAALIHDVLVIIGVFALLEKQIDMNFVAAALTIIGYSINNTIVIFDRIREHMRSKTKDETYDEIVNLSLLQSMRRTLNTSATTVLAVLVLYLVGSPSIRDFMLALLIGLTIGNYSSLFMATPLWSIWKTSAEKRSRAAKVATATGK
ncbi:MAG TPA: protein translocase subunit SecF [Firmicutes bacterium]|nr:protein translocase subunit SecF [Bacillota bacterium]